MKFDPNISYFPSISIYQSIDPILKNLIGKMSNTSEQAVVYAALILADDGVDITVCFFFFKKL
jgi:hypothetical protein